MSVQVDDAKTIPLKYMLDKNFTKNFFKSTLLTSFPELTGDTRKASFTEYIDRVKEQSKPVGTLSILITYFSPGRRWLLSGVCRWNSNIRGEN
jgi:hypothetical protein